MIDKYGKYFLSILCLLVGPWMPKNALFIQLTIHVSYDGGEFYSLSDIT